MASLPGRVGLFDAKTHLSSLVERVQRGEEVIITRHGTPVARLVPVDARQSDPRAAIERIRELRRGVKLKGITLRELIEEGRRR
ncbi:MAG: type II toxin-antitoxin system Phd/YefM family antitoxin [Candidatus Binatales bacterium]